MGLFIVAWLIIGAVGAHGYVEKRESNANEKRNFEENNQPEYSGVSEVGTPDKTSGSHSL